MLWIGEKLNGAVPSIAAAIAEGATIVRVGTAIYGARDYSKKA